MSVLDLIIGLVIVIYSAILHEIAHGFVAYRLGDPTAKLKRRITLNPIPHIDLFMTILMPVVTYFGSGGAVVLGGAKPVPVDPFNLREGRKDLALVSLAGPLTNILLAIVSSLLLHILLPHFSLTREAQSGGLAGSILFQIVRINLSLAIFNLVPIPPLDGSKVFSLVLPERDAAAYLSMGSMGMLLLLFLLYFSFGGFSLMGIVGTIINYLLTLLGF